MTKLYMLTVCTICGSQCVPCQESWISQDSNLCVVGAGFELKLECRVSCQKLLWLFSSPTR